ncbi:MAG: 50S ribosomal protein L24 [Bacteroidetes bacterium]|nr:50S ribosomal protein L24 [Bacteroidota bacterium]
MAKLKIKKGDTVLVISGEHKSSKERYKVLSVNTDTHRVTLEGVTVKKHTKPTSKYPNGGIVDVPATIHISNLMLVDGSGNATRVGRRVDEKTGKIERFSKKSKEAIK